MGMDGASLGDAQGLGRKRLDAQVVGAGCDRALDARFEELLEDPEQEVLSRDRQGKEAVDERRDRSPVLLAGAVLVRDGETRRVL